MNTDADNRRGDHQADERQHKNQNEIPFQIGPFDLNSGFENERRKQKTENQLFRKVWDLNFGKKCEHNPSCGQSNRIRKFDSSTRHRNDRRDEKVKGSLLDAHSASLQPQTVIYPRAPILGDNGTCTCAVFLGGQRPLRFRFASLPRRLHKQVWRASPSRSMVKAGANPPRSEKAKMADTIAPRSQKATCKSEATPITFALHPAPPTC